MTGLAGNGFERRSVSQRFGGETCAGRRLHLLPRGTPAWQLAEAEMAKAKRQDKVDGQDFDGKWRASGKEIPGAPVRSPPLWARPGWIQAKI